MQARLSPAAFETDLVAGTLNNTKSPLRCVFVLAERIDGQKLAEVGMDAQKLCVCVAGGIAGVGGIDPSCRVRAL